MGAEEENALPISASLLPEFDHEMANTRKTLERVPEDKFGWKPHAKSPELGWLASHVARLPEWAVMTMQQDSFDMSAPAAASARTKPATSRAELLATFDRNMAAARTAIAGANDEQMMSNWSLLSGEKTIFSYPRVAVLRSFVMNHMIHHRAQLTVYLRMNDVPVPALYGPSADETGV